MNAGEFLGWLAAYIETADPLSSLYLRPIKHKLETLNQGRTDFGALTDEQRDFWARDLWMRAGLDRPVEEPRPWVQDPVPARDNDAEMRLTREQFQRARNAMLEARINTIEVDRGTVDREVPEGRNPLFRPEWMDQTPPLEATRIDLRQAEEMRQRELGEARRRAVVNRIAENVRIQDLDRALQRLAEGEPIGEPNEVRE